MDVKEIEARVSEIAKMAQDDERAHAEEDFLWEAVLKAIEGGDPNPALLASAALKTGNIKFSRWCA